MDLLLEIITLKYGIENLGEDDICKIININLSEWLVLLSTITLILKIMMIILWYPIFLGMIEEIEDMRLLRICSNVMNIVYMLIASIIIICGFYMLLSFSDKCKKTYKSLFDISCIYLGVTTLYNILIILYNIMSSCISDYNYRIYERIMTKLDQLFF